MILLKPYKNSEKYTICKILLFGCFVNKKNPLTLHSESLVFEQDRMLNRGIAESLHPFGHFNISFATRHNQCWALRQAQ